MPINILILKFPYQSALGGGELHTRQLVENLKLRGFNFYLVSSCPILLSLFEKRNWPRKKIWLGIEPVTFWSVLAFPFFLPYLIFRLFFVLFWYKIKYKTTILYCLSLTEKLLSFLAFCLGFRVFWIEHQYPERWLEANPFLFLYRLNSRWAKIIAVSKAVRNKLIQLKIQPKQIKVIYNGLDFKKIENQKSKIKTKNKKQKIIIGTACRLAPEKKVDDLIYAFEKILHLNQPIELWICGIGPEEEKLKRIVKNLKIEDKVKFLGWQKNIYDFLSKIDIFALTSCRRESFGLAAAEAQAMGLPAVATKIGGLPEVVENGKTGYIVKVGDIKGLILALTKLIKNPSLREKMGEAAKIRAKKLFSQERMIKEFEIEFKKITQENYF